jgi:GntR family transcriptional regulator/MocR family aminotransferase
MRRVYQQRRDHLLGLLDRDLKHVLSPIASAYGLHLAVTVGEDVDTEDVSAKLAKEGVLCHALTRYFLGPAKVSGFVISYASADRAQLEIAIAALAQHLR